MANDLSYYGALHPINYHFDGNCIFEKASTNNCIQSYKKEVIANVIKDPLTVNEEWASRTWSIRQAATTKQFWLLCGSFFLANLTISSILAHQVAFFIDHGLTALFASYIAGLVGLVSIGAKIFWGNFIGQSWEGNYLYNRDCLLYLWNDISHRIY